ncbi:hypothetical protein G7L33_26630, partial [Klebsiella quasipneumoniae]|nr:hypothetical protein [Klebsiella quasipneumoniae]
RQAPPIPRVNSPLNTAVSPLASIRRDLAIFAEAILRQRLLQGLLNAGSRQAPPIPRVNSPLNTAVSPLASIRRDLAIFAE